MVREALGEDAIIIATREEAGGPGGAKMVHITAAIESDPLYTDAPRNHADIADDDWLYGDDDDEATVIEEITETMLRHSVPEEVLDQVVSCASIMGLEDSRIALMAALEGLFRFEPISAQKSSRPLILVGPPGAGKTLAAAKIAARSTMQGLNVAVITTDTVRAGGVEQLEAFTRLLDIPLHTAADAAELKERILEVRSADQIIIDTSGINPFDPESVKLTARLIGTAEMDPLMVLPAGVDAEESGEMARIFATIGTKSILSTRLDVARRLGGLLAAAHEAGLSFADVSDTPKVADGLTAMTPKKLSHLLMPRAEGATIDTQTGPTARKAG